LLSQIWHPWSESNTLYQFRRPVPENHPQG
jgi:hypothetical protein